MFATPDKCSGVEVVPTLPDDFCVEAQEISGVLQSPVQRGLQGGSGYSTTLATIEPIKYSGVIFCPTVSTGAFVARRNGKVFVTGNSGFPKSHNIGKAVDKLQGNERGVVGKKVYGDGHIQNSVESMGYRGNKFGADTRIYTKGTSEWEGWGTATKPAFEPVAFCTKPLPVRLIFGIMAIEITSLMEVRLCQKSNSNVSDVDRTLKSIHRKLEKAGVFSVAENARMLDWENIESAIIAAVSSTLQGGISKEMVEETTEDSVQESASQSGKGVSQESETQITKVDDLSVQMDILRLVQLMGSIDLNMMLPWNSILDDLLSRERMFTISTALGVITALKTLRCLLSQNTQSFTTKSENLKPANEPICLARKPLGEKTVAKNVLEHGVGGLNIDGCRVKSDVLDSERRTCKPAPGIWGQGKDHPQKDGEQRHNSNGRWPANVILSHDPRCQFVGMKKVKACGLGSKKGATGKDKCGQSGVSIGAESRPSGTEMINYGDENGQGTVEDWRCVEGCPMTMFPSPHGAGKARGAEDGAHSGKSGMFGIGEPAMRYGDQGSAARFFKQVSVEDWNCHPDCPMTMFPETKSGKPSGKQNVQSATFGQSRPGRELTGFGDQGSAARFFYCAKSSRSDRNEGCKGVLTWESVDLSQEMEELSLLIRDTSGDILLSLESSEWSTLPFGKDPTEKFLKGIRFTISTVTKLITDLKTLKYSQQLNIRDSILGAIRMIQVNGLSLVESVDAIRESKGNTTSEVMGLVLGVVIAALEILLKIKEKGKAGNIHSTVKPTSLMSYLCRLVTPPGGTILDPFCGSGSTGKGAVLEGFDFIGIEREPEYLQIAEKRIAHAQAQAKERGAQRPIREPKRGASKKLLEMKKKIEDKGQMDLFGGSEKK